MYFQSNYGKTRCLVSILSSSLCGQRSNRFNFQTSVRFSKNAEIKRPEFFVSVNTGIHERNFKLTTFIKRLCTILSTEEKNFQECVNLVSNTEISFSQNSSEIIELFSSFCDRSLVFMFDVVTFMSQTKEEDDNTIFLLSSLSKILSKRNLITISEGQIDISLLQTIMLYTMRLLNPQRHSGELISHINGQIRKNMDGILSIGSSTEVLKQLAYIMDPKVINTIVYTLLYKLQNFTPSDFTSLPELLFMIKMHDIRILSLILSHASENPYQVFGKNDSYFLKFLEDLSKFDESYRNENKVPNPLEFYMESLNDNVPRYDEDTLYSILSNISYIKNNYKGRNVLIGSILGKLGISTKYCTANGDPVNVKEYIEPILKSISDDNLIKLMKYTVFFSNVSSTENEWNMVERTLLGGNNNDKIHIYGKNTALINVVAEELSERIRKTTGTPTEIRNCYFSKPNVVKHIIIFINRCLFLNTERQYVNKIIKATKNIIKSMIYQKPDTEEFADLLGAILRVDVRIINEMSRELLDISLKYLHDEDIKAIHVVISGLTLLKTEIINHVGTHETLSDDNLKCIISTSKVLLDRSKNMLYLGKITEQAHIHVVISLCHLISDIKRLSKDSDINLKFEELLQIMKGFIENIDKSNLFKPKTINKLLKLQKGNEILLHVDELVKYSLVKDTPEMKLSQLVSIFTYKSMRMYDTKSFDSLLMDQLKNRICQLATNFNKTIEHEYSSRCYALGKENKHVKRVNPWDNDSELKILLNPPIEPYDTFLYEKNPEIGKYVSLGVYADVMKAVIGKYDQVVSLYHINLELLRMMKMLMNIKFILDVNSRLDAFFGLSRSLEEICSAVRECILTVAMCAPIKRNRGLPKRHVDVLIESSLKKLIKKKNYS
ncbi:hypothetical protein BEWA_018850 [Theileria equi strain WA]|uniref:Uncharacterized protein n=1 Tax=Theileria equi strain WA TaxID=1537102 RepID=L0AU17_THEEQ|nr:hypothetical protein BEWA_018850 [Theileria equi strain WA]AFZ79040.1 hypothetical protein BEWA_018850 [Theileria equi strain WA]|eukprot:XP_004828706.1 hypothetical protein BEWA_018850 [Theileria equi strain WA]